MAHINQLPAHVTEANGSANLYCFEVAVEITLNEVISYKSDSEYGTVYGANGRAIIQAFRYEDGKVTLYARILDTEDNEIASVNVRASIAMPAWHVAAIVAAHLGTFQGAQPGVKLARKPWQRA